MLVLIGLIALGLLLLLAGGEGLLRGAVGLATLLRLSPAVIGLTVVAAGTSVPELAVSGLAALQSKSEIAVANVVGSNIFNITVILGLCALLRPLPITGNVIRLEYPVLALVTLLCLALAADGEISRLDAVLCLATYGGFTIYVLSLVRQQVTASEVAELLSEVRELKMRLGQTQQALKASRPPELVASSERAGPPVEARPRLAICVGLVAGGIALLGAGAHFTVTAAVDLARILG